MKIGIIGGSGLNTIDNLEIKRRQLVNSTYGAAS